VGHSPGEKGIQPCYDEERQEETWDENCRQHLADFADKLSEKLLEEIDQYQKQTCQKPTEHNNILAGFQHLDDPYLSRLSEELQDLTKLSEELQERNSYLASLNNSIILEEIQPSSPRIEDPQNITENRDPFLDTLHYSDAAVELNSNTVVLDLYKQAEKPEPEPNINLTISNEPAEDISSESDVVLMCNTCSRQTSDDITEDLDTCVEVLSKGENDELQEEEGVEEEDMPQEICDEAEELVPTAVHTAPERCDAEPSHLLRSIAGSIISLRPGYSMESSDTGDMSEQTATSGSDCSRRDTTSAGKTESIGSLGPNSIECCDAVTGNDSDCNRSLLHADRRKMNCGSKSYSEDISPRGISMKEATQEPPEVLTKTESCASSLSGSTSQESLPSDNGGGAITFHRYYHVFREGELDQLIERYVENLHIISSYYDHANWCVVAEKVHVWTI
jgi:hypothetical protein